MSTDEERFAANLRAMRESSGLTQAALANEMTKRGARWHQATVYKVENGERQIQLSEATLIAKILGASLDMMLNDPHESQIERQLDYDINRFRHAHDRIPRAVIEFDTGAREALSQSVAAARSIQEASPGLVEKVQIADELLKISAQSAFETGMRAAKDPEIAANPYLFRLRFGLADEEHWARFRMTERRTGDDSDA